MSIERLHHVISQADDDLWQAVQAEYETPHEFVDDLLLLFEIYDDREQASEAICNVVRELLSIGNHENCFVLTTQGAMFHISRDRVEFVHDETICGRVIHLSDFEDD